MSPPKFFLFSIDLEEFESIRCPFFRKTPLPDLTELFLDFLAISQMTATFFVVGKVARAYPALISKIFDAGHELACHTDQHIPLDRLNRTSFRADLERNRGALLAAAPKANILGFRAPLLSITPQTVWAYEILADLGFQYSSSVLPAASPLFGWPNFGQIPRQFGKIWEVPISLGSGWRRSIPFAAGSYFRCLPACCIFNEFKRAKKSGSPVVGYFHPYDVDVSQQYVLHRELGNKPYLNPFLYWGRHRTLIRLKRIIKNKFIICRYDQYLKEISSAPSQVLCKTGMVIQSNTGPWERPG